MPATPKLLLAALAFAPFPGAIAQEVGPMVGQVGDHDARFLYRPDGVVQTLRLSVLGADGSVIASDTVTNAAADDYVAHFHATGLSPSTAYGYRLEQIAGNGSATWIAGGDDLHRFRTFGGPGERGVFTAAFASCANATSEPVWERIDSLNVNALFLMGDTPYIDSTALATVRSKQRGFLLTPAINRLIRHVPTTATWDDHDFGANNGNGLSVANKAQNRKGFVEYRAHERYGTGTEGIYNSVTCGPMEVFLIDDRWFTQTAASPVDPSKPTFFGSAQWTWLLDAIKRSRAPFKVLAFGAIWQDKKNTENDDLFTYWYERDALFDFIRNEKIPGVVLLGGDIHVSRHLIHPRRVDYDLHDFVTSPAHTSTIASLDVYNPDLEWSSISDRQFLTLSVDTRIQPAVLTAKFLKHDGTVQRTVTVPYDQLVPRSGTGLARDLCAYWPFDANGENRSAQGSRIDASAVSGAGIGSSAGVLGNAASFTRSAGQYLKVPRGVLPENSARYTASLWCKPASLPAHGSADRHALLETTPAAPPASTGTGYCISIDIQAASASDKVDLSLFTHTLKPAAPSANGTTAPTELAQGPFSTQVDRSLLLDHWNHLAVTFDSTKLQLFINGQPVASFTLPTPGPLSENGGLVIGGHRAGTGRNFDGLIDEVAIWSRDLTPTEISGLYHGGSPTAIPVQVAAVDTDGDSLPDWWEITQGLDPQSAADAMNDQDGDGVPAFIEFSMGTSPLHDDTGFYSYVRRIASPDQADAARAFKNPADDKVGVELLLESSTDLSTWTPIPLGSPEAGIESLDQLLKLKLPPSPGTQRFFRFRAQAAKP